jgi:heme-degrading monooxygenase HmoA
MFAVVFAVQPRKACWDTYLELAKFLKPKLEQTEGFIDNERFESKRTAGRLLSLSTWRDEKALVRWRTHAEHHTVQEKGRFEVFEDYHLRVGEITDDSHEGRGNRIAVAHRDDATEVGRARALTLTEVLPAEAMPAEGASAGVAHAAVVPASVEVTQWHAESLQATLALNTDATGLIDTEVFASLYTPGKLLLLASWETAEHAQAFAPAAHRALEHFRHRQITVIRDYGMRDRREAPQYYAAVGS